MKLIIEALEESHITQYEYLSANMLLDPNLISLNLIARQNAVRGELNIRGLMDASEIVGPIS
ncbi:hypothetical protein SAMN05216464_1314 [Mucilaginibacter pineti]|uniref:Uncharacterized protein n=1 Tax=Mucilaginibacter pineti TaxID=1391627 RepID=A0A1G7NXY8_9SPHI|nr:hypothetical protein [Mucilaginibacter pineti]SDF78833.1 hypothetical protein SAMN05216464_1314 [Mucilaginibacter pineti]